MFNHTWYKFSRLFAEKEASRPEYLFKILNTPSHVLAITSISFFFFKICYECPLGISQTGRKIPKGGELWWCEFIFPSVKACLNTSGFSKPAPLEYCGRIFCYVMQKDESYGSVLCAVTTKPRNGSWM